MKRIAIFSPSLNAYSETFIQEHKDRLNGHIFFYSGEHNFNLNGNKIRHNKICWVLYKILTVLKVKKWKVFEEELLVQNLKQNKIDVVLVEYGNHAFNLLPVLVKSKIPFVTHFHGYDASVTLLIKSCDFYRQVFSLSRKIVVVSSVMKNQMLKLGCSPNKLVITPCGPNEKFLSLKPRFSNKTFFAMGRFVNKKAPYLTLMAFKEVVKIHPDADLLIAGDGPLMDACINLSKQFKIDKHVKFTGVVSPENAMRYMEESICFVQHSITSQNGDMEGTPVAILEACAAGLPVVSTRHAGISDVIIHGKTGYLCEEGDIHAMSKYMSELASDFDKAKKLGLNARNFVSANYSLDRHIKEIEMALDS